MDCSSLLSGFRLLLSGSSSEKDFFLSVGFASSPRPLIMITFFFQAQLSLRSPPISMVFCPQNSPESFSYPYVPIINPAPTRLLLPPVLARIKLRSIASSPPEFSCASISVTSPPPAPVSFQGSQDLVGVPG